MKKDDNQKLKTKLKLLYIKQYLEKHSDETNPVSAQELLDYLEQNSILCERKSIYSDVKSLREYGMDIFRVRVPKNGYYIGTREFELPEVRLLIDAVKAANFITTKKTKVLIEKIGSLCSEGQLSRITQQVYVDSPVKCTNEDIYYNIDIINRAIEKKKQIKFVYRRRVLNEKGQITFEQKTHTVSPYAMIWSDDHYYLVGNNQKYDNLMHMRIDRMKKIEITEDYIRPFCEVSQYKSFFDAADYSAKAFSMFSGEVEKLEFIADKSIIEAVLDRFGSSAVIKSAGGGKINVSATVIVSEGLVGWIMQYGVGIEIVSPESLRDKILEKSKEISMLYTVPKQV